MEISMLPVHPLYGQCPMIQVMSLPTYRSSSAELVASILTSTTAASSQTIAISTPIIRARLCNATPPVSSRYLQHSHRNLLCAITGFHQCPGPPGRIAFLCMPHHQVVWTPAPH